MAPSLQRLFALAPFLSTLTFFFLAACSSTILRLLPAEGESAWTQGDAVLRSALPGSVVILTYKRHESGMMVFDVEIENESEDTLLVDPTEIFYTTLTVLPVSPSAPEQPSSQRRYAVDPEKRILDLEKQMAGEEDRYTAAVVVDGVFSLIGLVADVASIGTRKTTEELREREERDRALDESRYSRDAEHDRTMGMLGQSRNVWRDLALRKTTLPPWDAAGGEVSLPQTREARFLTVIVPVGKDMHRFVFKQVAL